MSSSNKNIILVTGGNTGIGLEVVRQLLADATNHVIIGSRSVEKGDAAAKTLLASSPAGTVEIVQLNVDDESSSAKAAEIVENSHGKLDQLVNNAGIAYNADSAPPSIHMARVFHTNVIGVHLVTEAFVPLLRKSTSTPRIVNVTSGAGSISTRLSPPGALVPSYRTTAYQCSKAALNMLTADQAAWYKGEGFKVFAVCPGFCESGLGPNNTVEKGAKPVREGGRIVVEVVRGGRDGESGGFLHGDEVWNEKRGNGQYPW